MAIRMTVSPLPVLALVPAIETPVIAVRPMGFDNPLIVVNAFRRTPDVVVRVGRIIGPVADVGGATCEHRCPEKRTSQKCPNKGHRHKVVLAW
jgi:hypothetical protein